MRVDRYVVALALAYLAGLAVLVASPWGWQLNRLTVRLWVFFRYDWTLAPAWIAPEHFGIALNVLLFVPAGILLALATRRPWWWVALVSLAGSSLVELVQWRWLEREGTWVDIAANTLGAAVGAALVTLRGRAGSRPAGRSGPRRRP